ncbi:MAG: hypothetical protein WDM85_10460 [Caulobacteraceae bacterium]
MPLYLCGHDHDLQHITRGETHYVCTGAGSKTRDHCHEEGGDFCSVESGFTVCVASPTMLWIGYRDWKGEGLYVVEIAGQPDPPACTGQRRPSASAGW